jgi:23S rRNA (cytosine1962-C5)-methyltransferase
LATGIYVDQRATRIWLQQQIAKRNQHSQRNRVINLFAYTGIFSCAALAAGAEHAIDIDLSGPALATAAKNAANNGHTAHHDIIQGDCLQALNELPAQSCDILICDPPTAAGGKNTSKGPSAQAAKTNAMTNKQGTSKDTGHKGWVVRRDYPTLLQACERVLAPGGLLITCCNTLGRKAFDLPAAVADIGLEVAAPELGSDLPQKRGFPEGRPFQIVVRKK